mmetsp:Transcript_11177/g.28717  ORF Transcript_11177/g.28717 Transcript_11177/m.28717 type:complete len:207 (+) Transcript_11177:1770-2390(+)
MMVERISTACWCSAMNSLGLPSSSSSPTAAAMAPESRMLLLSYNTCSFLLNDIVVFKSTRLSYSGRSSEVADPSQDRERSVFLHPGALLLASSLFAMSAMKVSTMSKKQRGSIIRHTSATFPSIGGTMFMPLPRSSISTSFSSSKLRSEMGERAGEHCKIRMTVCLSSGSTWYMPRSSKIGYPTAPSSELAVRSIQACSLTSTCPP